VSRRERVSLALGVIGAILLVVYPMAYRLTTEDQKVADVTSPAASIATPSIAPTLEAPSPITPVEPEPALGGSWRATAEEFRGQNGITVEFACSPDGQFWPIWGSGDYTDDSSVCTAGVHRGVITRESGGIVTIIIRPGHPAYPGSTRNGVSTDPYEAWEGSYEVVEPDDV
jgi:hypothetical protein